MEAREVLEELDLTDSEITIYLTLLREGSGTASHIATKAGIGRRLAYDRFEDLQERGLVSYTDKGNRRVYQPCDPARLHGIVEDRRRDLEVLEDNLEDVVPDLQQTYLHDKPEREVKILEGKQGVKTLFNEQLREEDDEIRLFGSPLVSEDVLGPFLPHYSRKRAKEGVSIKGVFESEMRGRVGHREGETEARFLPKEYDSRLSISVFGDKVGIIFWLDDPLVLLIEDADAARSFDTYFDLIWRSSED